MQTDRRAEVVIAAQLAAKLFIDEHPGQACNGDWDSLAWSETVHGLQLSESESERLWPTFHDTLHRQIESQLMYVRYLGHKICYTILQTGGFIMEDVEGANDDVIAICDAGGGTMTVTDSVRMLAAWNDQQ